MLDFRMSLINAGRTVQANAECNKTMQWKFIMTKSFNEASQ